MFVKFLLDFYIQYFIIVLVLFIVTWHLSASFIRALALLMLGILFPVADIFIPSLWFSSYCKANLKYVDKGPIKNVRGYYAENPNGVCSVYCTPSVFIDGFDYIEGRIDRKKKRSSLYNIQYLDSDIVDKHGSLYRFSLLNLKYNIKKENEFKCQKTNRYIKYTVRHNKIAHMCVKVEKIKQPSGYNHLRKKYNHKSLFGNITENSKQVTNSSGEEVFYINSFNVKKFRTLLYINQIFYLNGSTCSIPSKARRKSQANELHSLVPPK